MHHGHGQAAEEELAEEHYSRGRELFAQDKPLAAKGHLERALELDPDFDLARKLLARLEAQLKN
jgi:tetratricopeptide (TPR) repeat protein